MSHSPPHNLTYLQEERADITMYSDHWRKAKVHNGYIKKQIENRKRPLSVREIKASKSVIGEELKERNYGEYGGRYHANHFEAFSRNQVLFKFHEINKYE